jgi:hypothetical protein
LMKAKACSDLPAHSTHSSPALTSMLWSFDIVVCS